MWAQGWVRTHHLTMNMLTMLAPQTLLCLACLALGSTEASFRAHRAHLKPRRFGRSAEAIFASCQTFHSSHLRQQSREMIPSPPVSLGLPHLPGTMLLFANGKQKKVLQGNHNGGRMLRRSYLMPHSSPECSWFSSQIRALRYDEKYAKLIRFRRIWESLCKSLRLTHRDMSPAYVGLCARRSVWQDPLPIILMMTLRNWKGECYWAFLSWLHRIVICFNLKFRQTGQTEQESGLNFHVYEKIKGTKREERKWKKGWFDRLRQ